MKVSIIIPNYNGRKLLGKNLPGILKASQGAEIIVSDDASSDGSIEYLKSQISNIKDACQKANIKLIQNKKNLGFASSVNKAVEESAGELVVLINTDVCPEKDFLEAALLHFTDPKVFAVGCLQRCSEDGSKVERGRGIGKFNNGFLVHARGEVDKTNTLWVSGGAGIFRKSIWQKLGGLNEIYNPFYWEDIDLSYRALKAGYKLVFEPKSVVIHEQQTGSIRNNYSAFQIRLISYRNQILFVWLNITDILFLFEHLFFLPYYLIRSLLNADRSFIIGFFRALILLPQVLNQRHKNAKLTQISDKKILKNFSH